jgi:L-iditol 2-dehydrogenase
MKFRAACLVGLGQIRLVERELTLDGDEVLVKTHQASICQADVKTFTKGCYVDGVPTRYPFFPGHEAGGEVVEVGSRVHEYRPGDKVMLMHNTKAAAGGPGGLAEYFKMKPSDLIMAPPGLDMDIASLAETICPFVFVVHRSGVKLGDTAVVTGLNFIGQIVAQGLKNSGAARVIAVDKIDFRLAVARKMGADVVVNSQKEDPLKRVRELTNGEGADVVCQTASYTDDNVEEYMNLATELVKNNGIVAFQGDFLHPITLRNIHRWHVDSLDIRSIAFRHYTWHHMAIWAYDCLRPVQTGQIKINPLITGRYRLEQIEEAYQNAAAGVDYLKVIIKP